MTPEELKIICERLGLNIPEAELNEILTAVTCLENMRAEVRKLDSCTTEPAHNVLLPESLSNDT